MLIILLLLFLFFTPPALAVNCANVPINGNYTVDTACSFANTVDGVDAGTGTVNSAVLTTATNGSLTVGSGTTLVAGSINLTGGSIVLINGAQIKIGTPLFATDTDADGYPSSTSNFYTSAATGRIRRNTLTALTVDCNDASASLYRSVAGYLDSDGDGYGTGAYATCVGASGSYVASGADCYDANANAYPGSGACSGSHRGDGSYDYNCASGSTLCGTTLVYPPGVWVTGEWALGSCNQGNSRCSSSSNSIYSAASIGCGQTGSASCTGWSEQVGGWCVCSDEACGTDCGSGGGYQWPCTSVSAPTAQTCQ